MNHVKFKHGAATMGAYGCANAYHLLQFLAASNDDVVKACTMTEAELRAHTDNSIPLPNSFAAWGTRCAYSQARGAESLFISSVFRDPLARPDQAEADARTAKYFAAIEAEKAEAEAYVENAQRDSQRLNITLWPGDRDELGIFPVNSVELVISGGLNSARDICVSWVSERQRAMLAAAMLAQYQSSLASAWSDAAILEMCSYFEERPELFELLTTVTDKYDKQLVISIDDPQRFTELLVSEKADTQSTRIRRQMARKAASDLGRQILSNRHGQGKELELAGELSAWVEFKRRWAAG